MSRTIVVSHPHEYGFYVVDFEQTEVSVRLYFWLTQRENVFETHPFPTVPLTFLFVFLKDST